MPMLCSNRNANNVVLLSDNEDEACEMAREYIRRVSKWHGEEGRLVLYVMTCHSRNYLNNKLTTI